MQVNKSGRAIVTPAKLWKPIKARTFMSEPRSQFQLPLMRMAGFMQNVNIAADLMQEKLIYCNKLSGRGRTAPSNVPLRLRYIISFLSPMSATSEEKFMMNSGPRA